MRASDIATTRVIIVAPEQSIRDAAHLMHHHLTGCLVVARRSPRGTVPVGILTDRDISRLLSDAGDDVTRLRVDSVMSYPLVLCRHDATLAELVCMMHGNGTRRLPVVDDDGYLVGIVTAHDALVAVTELLRRLTEVLLIEPAMGDRMAEFQHISDVCGSCDG